MKTATITRNTRETQIRLSFNPGRADGGKDIGRGTGLPFLDHMLAAFACHGRFDLKIEAMGDLDVDPHHLIEDVGIVLGEAILNSLPGYSGIMRAGCFSFPMDASLATVALDLCGRPNLIWNVAMDPFPVGGVNPLLFREFFKGLVDGMRGTLHIHLVSRDNDHHALESIFKAFGRALREAVTPLDTPDALSTKGKLDA